MNHDVEPTAGQPMPSSNGQPKAGSVFRRLFEGVAVLGSRNVLMVGTDFFSALLLIRLLAPEDYARLTLALSARRMASVFLDLGLSQFMATEIARSLGLQRLDQVKRFLLRYGQMSVMLGAAFLFLAIVAQWPLCKLMSPLMAWLVLFVGIDLFMTVWRQIIRVTFWGYSRFANAGAIDIIESVFKLGFLFIVLVLLDWGLRGAILVYPLSTGFALSMVLPGWLRLVRPLRKISPSRDAVFRQGLMGPGKWVILMQPLKQLRDELPLWLIEWILGSTGVAIYAVAKKGYNYTALLLSPVEEILMPLVSENIEQDRQIVYRLAYSVGKFALVGAVLLLAGGAILSSLFFDRVFEYPEAASVYRVLLLTLPLRALTLYQRPMLFALRGQKSLALIMAYSVLMLAGIVGLGSILFGTVGVAFGLFLNLIFMSTLRQKAIQSLEPEFHISLGGFFCISEFDRMVFARLRKRLFSRVA